MVRSVDSIGYDLLYSTWRAGQRVRVKDDCNKEMGDGVIDYLYGVGVNRRASVLMEFPEKMVVDVPVRKLQKIY